MTKQELEAYLDALNKAVYIAGTGYAVEVDGEYQVFTLDKVLSEQKRVAAEIKKLGGPSVIERGARAVAGALVRTPEEIAARRRREQIGRGQAKLSAGQDKLIAAFRKAESDLDITASLLVQGSATRKASDLARDEKRLQDAEAALKKVGLFVDNRGNIVRETAARGAQNQRGGSQIVDASTGDFNDRRTLARDFVKTDKVDENTDDEETTTTDDSTLGTGGDPVTGGPSGGRDGRQRRANEAAIQKKLLEMFPGLRPIILDEDGVFGTEIRDLLFRAYREKWTEDKFELEFKSTAYYNNTADVQRQFDELDSGTKRMRIDDKYGELTRRFGTVFGTPAIGKTIAREILRNGLKGASADTYVYSRLRDAGQRDILFDSPDADNARKIARNYMYNLSYPEVEALLVGETTIADLENRLRARAKVDYPHLVDAFDQGLTPMDIAEPRRRIVGRLLERPDEEIDFTDPRFMRLLDKSQVNDGPMSLAEVARLIKSDPSYGYQYTTQANQQATSFGSMIAKMFGARA